MLHRALEQARYNQRRAADLLSVTYHQLRAMMKKHNVDINADEAERRQRGNPLNLNSGSA